VRDAPPRRQVRLTRFHDGSSALGVCLSHALCDGCGQPRLAPASSAACPRPTSRTVLRSTSHARALACPFSIPLSHFSGLLRGARAPANTPPSHRHGTYTLLLLFARALSILSNQDLLCAPRSLPTQGGGEGVGGEGGGRGGGGGIAGEGGAAAAAAAAGGGGGKSLQEEEEEEEEEEEAHDQSGRDGARGAPGSLSDHPCERPHQAAQDGLRALQSEVQARGFSMARDSLKALAVRGRGRGRRRRKRQRRRMWWWRRWS